MPGKIRRIAISPPKRKTDFTGILIEFKSNGHCAVGVVERVAKYGYEVDVLASDFDLDIGAMSRTVPFKSPYKNINRDDLPVYVGLKYTSERFEDILRGDE